LLQIEQLLYKESKKAPTEFHKSYFSEECEPDFEDTFTPSPAVSELGTYLQNFVAKLRQTMI